MIVLCRFVLAEAEVDDFVRIADGAVAVMAAAPGCVSAEVGRNLDDPTLFTLVSRWQDVGSYRRGLQSFEAKVAVVPLLSRAIDEPTAYEAVGLVGRNLARGSGPPGLS